MNDISGKYKGYSRKLFAVSMVLLWIYAYVWLVFIEDLVESAAGAFAAAIPTIFGAAALALHERLPCRFTADEKSFTISAGGIKHSFRIGEVSGISCEYERHGDTQTKVKLTVTDSKGKTARFAEIHNNDIAHLKYDENAEKPQLMRLCEYVNAAKGAAE